MPLTVVSGVPGVGSSRVCEAARKRLDDAHRLVNFGDVMLQEALGAGIETRDDLAQMTPRELRVLQRRAGEFVAAREVDRDRSVILNTHLVVNTASGFLPGMPETVLADLSPDAFVLVEAEPTAIRDRRDSSEYRQYPGDEVLGIEFHQDLSRSAATWCSMAADAPVHLVENTDSVEAAAEQLVEVLSA
ncbi:MAG: adenylate kinase [Salinigranum sp.]